MTAIDPGSQDVVEQLGPEKFRDCTVEILGQRGARLVGDHTTIQMLLEYAEADFAAQIRDEIAMTQVKPRGRPANDLISSAIITAAFMKFHSEGVSRAAACLKAAKWLGEPMTADKIDKNERSFFRQMTRVTRILPRETVLQMTDGILRAITTELAAVKATMEADRIAENARRKRNRFASFSA